MKRYYEWGIVILLSLLFGAVILNRLAIVYLFPFIVDEFKISYAQAGALTSVLAVTFAFSAWVFGGLSDRIGRKIVVIFAAAFFSIMSWFSGVAFSFWQMFLARGLLGMGQGAVVPASIATISAESSPNRRGFNFGLHQSLSPLMGAGIGAIAVTQLTKIMPWRWVFFVVGVPSLIICIILYFYMREPKTVLCKKDKVPESRNEKPSFFSPLRYRNIILSSIVAFLLIGSMFIFITFSIIYLTREINLSIAQSGAIVSLLGFGAFLGCILMPLVSDHIGRKGVIIPLSFGGGVCLAGFVLSGSNYLLLGICVTTAGFSIGGTAPLVMSALTTESVPPHLAATASGITVFIGDIFGAALMPFLAGYLADLYGLRSALFLCAVTPIIAGFVSILYEETAPKIIARKEIRGESVT